jgi:regulatory protein
VARRQGSSRSGGGPRGSCRGSALSMLAARGRSEEDLRRKLLERGFPDAEVAATVSELVESGALAEASAAEVFVRLRRHRWGRERLEMELRQRLFKEETISVALEGFEPEEESRLARRLAAGGTARPTRAAERRRLFARLRRKGISVAVAIQFAGPDRGPDE